MPEVQPVIALKDTLRLLRRLLRAVDADRQLTSDEALAGHALLHLVTYQLPAKANSDPWIGIRELVRTTRKIFSVHTATRKLQPENAKAILGGFMHSWQVISDYIGIESGSPAGWYIAKAEWPEYTGRGRLVFWLRWMRFALPFSLRCIAAGNRTNLALIIRESAGMAMLLHWLRTKHIQHLFDFLPYELDSNAIALLCRHEGIKVTKIPSSGPLAAHNRFMICDVLALSTPYQEEELDVYRKTIRFSERQKWAPEKAHTFIETYRQQRRTPVRGVIGFYSHASWLRQKEGHSDDGLHIGRAEQQLIADLLRFVSTHASSMPSIRLAVFLHPREKKQRTTTEAHYAELLGGIPYAIHHSDAPTSQQFDACDVALAAYSSVVFERLFCGYKTLIGNYGIPGFPMPGSSLSRICFDNYEAMRSLLSDSLHDDEERFFEHMGLKSYRYDSYPQYR